MPRYEVSIQTPKMKQTFITEDIEDDQARRTRLKSFIDAFLLLRDYIINIKPLNTLQAKPAPQQAKDVQCLYEQGRTCPFWEDQTIDTCLHCDGRGLE